MLFTSDGNRIGCKSVKRKPFGQNPKKKKVLLVSDPGGHLSELLVLSEAFDANWEKTYVTFPEKYATLENCHYFKRSKWISLDIIIFSIRIFCLILAERPDIVVSTGSYIGMVAIVIAKIFWRIPCIFMECSAQVYTPSKTGKIVYHFTDLFLVQWEELLKKYGSRAKYVGGLI